MKTLAKIPSMLLLGMLIGLVPGLSAGGGAAANDAVPVERSIQRITPQPLDSATDGRLSSEGTGPLELRKRATDLFYLYGAPGSGEGTFEDGSGNPDRQGWSGVDMSDVPNHWQVSPFNAETLGDHGPGNHAVWAGLSVEQAPGWASAPGYGNNWNDLLRWSSPPLLDTSIGQTVELDFSFHHDSEPGYDFFSVEYDSAGFAPRPGGYYTGGGASGIVMTVDGTDADAQNGFTAPGERFSDHQIADIAFAGNDYGGEDSDQIVILLRFSSDGGWSDEDGLWTTTAGAVQVDDLRVRWDDGSGVMQESFEDFEGFDPLRNGDWALVKAPFAGDFSAVLPGLRDLDPCWENSSPAVTFVDYGQTVGNAESAADIAGFPTSTGGTTSSNWTYGPGGFVLNYEGGLTENTVNLFNEFWSPPIDFDLPGSADDDPEIRAMTYSFDSYEHLLVTDGLFWVWAARVRTDGGDWTDWRNDNFVRYSPTPRWTRASARLTGLFDDVAVIDQVQLSFGIWDLANVFGFPGNDATPGFYVDNVTLTKERIEGPRVSARETELALGGFPSASNLDASTAAARDLLDVRFDMARDIGNSWDDMAPIDPGDSLVVEVQPMFPGSTVADVRLVWALDRNLLFDDVRVAPSRPRDVIVDTSSDPTRWFGETVADEARTSSGAVIEGRYAVDLPDEDFLYPGDVLRYYIRAVDDGGRVTTLPRDVDGFGGSGSYSETFTVRALPTIHSASGNHPPVLVNDTNTGESSPEFLSILLDQMGWTLGVDYDLHRRSAPQSLASDGIGGAVGHGATPTQLAGYTTLLFDHSRATSGFSDGSNTDGNDKSDDVQLVRDWLDLPGDRAVVHLGLDQGGGLSDRYGTASAYATDILGIQLTPPMSEVPVSFAYEGLRQAALTLGPEFDLYGGCQIDTPSVLPGGGSSAVLGLDFLGGRVVSRSRLDPSAGATVATVGHVLVDTRTGEDLGAAITFREWLGADQSRKVAVASVIRPTDNVGDAPHPGGALPTSVLFRELLEFADDGLWFGLPTNTPRALQASFAIAPSPFNPRTVISLVIPITGRTTVVAYDVRGRRIRTLHDGDLESGVAHQIAWDGRDDQGVALASGVYFVSAQAPRWSERKKVVLLK